MELEKKIYTTELKGKPITLEFSNLARQANQAVIGKWGDTVVLTTVVMSKEDREGDFFPLTVDYEEKFYAAGKILGSRFMRREGRPSDEAILSARLIDRVIRPLFDHRMRRSVQIVNTILSYDGQNDPEPVALLNTSAVLATSDVPWDGPVAGIPIITEDYTALFAGTKDRINMIEFEGDEVQEEEALRIFDESLKEISSLIDFQNKIVKEIGKEKEEIIFLEHDPKLLEYVRNFCGERLEEAIYTHEKTVRASNLNILKNEMLDNARVENESEENIKAYADLFEHEVDRIVRDNVVKNQKRPDLRKIDQVRDLFATVHLFERNHGSGLFIRGETQTLAMTTLAPPGSEQLIDSIEEQQGKRRFMLHYNFPKYSVGEAGPARSPGRREIGHGALARKAIARMIPKESEFPYTIRVVCETLSSNGSTSMAATCAAVLSLMDAGVKIKKPVAGIAMGLMTDDETGEYIILTDIQGPEDHQGDMDLKVAGTKDGLTAMQMDVKINGITKDIFKDTLERAEKARLGILDVMTSAIAEPRGEISAYAPKLITLKIDPEKIGLVIGPGGKTIRSIVETFENKVEINIDEDGMVVVSGENKEIAEKAMEKVKEIVREFKIGEKVTGKIIKVLDFGAILDLGGGKDGMIHVSELSNTFVKNINDLIKVGDEVTAKVIKVENGKIGLSLKK